MASKNSAVRRSVKGYIVAFDTAFVPHPGLWGLWMKTHPCVLVVECPRCGSKPGEPCQSSSSLVTPYISATHVARRGAFDGRVPVMPLSIILPQEEL